MPLLPHAELSCLSLETLDMKSAAMNRVLGDLTSAQSNPSSEAGAYAWLNLPAVSSVAVTPDSNRELLDEVDRLIASYSEFPHGYPENKKTDEFRIRIRYRRTNDQQASASFANILENYRAHVLHKRASELTAYPYTLEYLIADPLGREELDISDTRIFRNANRLTAAAANGGAVTDLTEGGDDDSDSNGDNALSGPADAASATASASGAEGAPAQTPPVPRVKTAFAALLETLQLDLYLYLRSNVSRFMDETSKNVINNRIKTYEHDKGLTGRGRLNPELRYTWQRLKADVYDLCCSTVTGGFYFSPYYTTPRFKDMIVVKWCTVIRKIHAQLIEFNSDWGKLSERDAMKRLRAFLSKKEVEVIEAEIQQNHPEIWTQHRKSIRIFFNQHSLGDALRLINNIDTAKFPLGFDPVKHTPEALRETLYTYSYLEQKMKQKNAELAVAKKRIEKLESQLAAANKSRAKRNQPGDKTPLRATRALRTSQAPLISTRKILLSNV